MTLRYALTAFVSLLALDAARAETVINTNTTANLRTSTAASGARDDLRIAAAGSVRPSGGAAVTLDSDNTVANAGAIAIQNADSAVGVLLEGGRRGSFANTGSITIDESANPTDTDNDGDLDGRFATGTGRFGVRLTGAQAFTGSLTHGGSILVEGNNSAGISLEAPLTGGLTSTGTVSVVGDASAGLRLTGPVSGALTVGGVVSARGAGSVGVAVEGPVGGALVVNGAVTATGYRSTTASTDPSFLSKLDADDLLQGGPALLVTGSVAGGLLLDTPPPNLSPTDNDEDKDGTPDASETTGALSVFGAAPALQVGGGEAMTLGAVAGDGFGLVLKGGATAAGVYSGVSATAVRLGGAGGRVDVKGGVRVSGSVGAAASEADATALRIAAGANAPAVEVRGVLSAASTAEAAVRVQGVQIDADGAIGSLRNSGSITASARGEAADVRAVSDLSGRLTLLENAGMIAALLTPTDGSDAGDDPADETITGTARAFDLSANTSGVMVRQFGITDGDDGADGAADPDSDKDGVDDNNEPSIVGDMLFGSGADSLLLENGVATGAVRFGAGADVLRISGGAVLSGALSDSDGKLDVTVQNGRLRIDNTGLVNLTSLNVGSGGALVLTADPSRGTVTQVVVAGTATLAAGSTLGLNFASKLTGPQTYRLVSASSLTSGVTSLQLENTPFLYVGALSTSAGAVDVTIRRRTAEEIGMTAAQAAAFDAVYASFDQDARVGRTLLSKTSASDFLALYDQFLPDYAGGVFAGLETARRAVQRGVREAGSADTTDEGAGAWVEQSVFNVEKSAGATQGYENSGFLLAGGAESAVGGLGVLGLSFNLITGKTEDSSAALLEDISMTSLGAGLYWRKHLGALQLHADAGAGRVSVESSRALRDQNVTLAERIDADWGGYTLAGAAGASWRGRFGPLSLTPQLSLDYFRLSEEGYAEASSVSGVALTVEERTSDLLSTDAKLSFGMRFGRTFQWGPELTVGWRQVLSGDLGETTARFGANGQRFSLVPDAQDGGGAIARLAFTAGDGAIWRLKLEAGGEELAERTSYDARASLRLLF